MNGFYVAYMTGRAGTSILLFLIRDGLLVGADIGGMKYDGEVQLLPNGSVRLRVVYVVPAGLTLITGSQPADVPQRIPFEFELPANFDDGRVIPLVTPLGPVNAKFEKIRDL